jgi:isopentenyl-diphosphate delta-isomerase
MPEYIITVDEQDREIGSIEKMEAHRQGVLHRAFSILVFNKKGEILLQRRALHKYHTPGLWSNTCCSHQRVGETLEEAVARRLQKELGFTCDCKEIHHFKYHVEFDNGLIEHEMDHVFIGEYDGEVIPNNEEVDEIRWVKLDDLRQEMKEKPEKFTYWFKILMEQLEQLPVCKLM